MNQAMVDKIVQAVLYEGYNLYPYRPSVKNRCRWTFGGLYPRSYSEAAQGTDAWSMQVQCLVQAASRRTAAASRPCEVLEVQLRFLHLTPAHDRRVAGPLRRIARGKGSRLRGRRFAAAERDALSELAGGGRARSDDRAARARLALEPSDRQILRCPCQPHAGTAPRPGRADRGGHRPRSARRSKARRRSPPNGWRSRSFDSPCGFSIAHRWKMPASRSRDEALMRSLVAMHAVLIVREGKFFSLTDPPEALRAGGGRLPEPRCVAGPRRFARRAGCHAGLADHPLRLSADRPGKSGRSFRRHGDRRDPDAANHDPHRGRKGDGRGDRRPHAAAHRADRVAGSRATRRAARGSPIVETRRDGHASRPDQGRTGGMPIRAQRLGPVCPAAGNREHSSSTTSNCGRATGCDCGRGWAATSSIWP